jgi:hypothetical protein
MLDEIRKDVDGREIYIIPHGIFPIVGTRAPDLPLSLGIP